MGTKNNPGDFDCYANADPDEPMFILLGRDPFAPMLVEFWAQLRADAGDAPEKVSEAKACSVAMREYLKSMGRREPSVEVLWEGNGATLETLKGRKLKEGEGDA